MSATQFGHRADLLSEDAFGLARLHLDQVLRLIIIHDMDESELGARCLAPAGQPAARRGGIVSRSPSLRGSALSHLQLGVVLPYSRAARFRLQRGSDRPDGAVAAALAQGTT